MDLRIEYKKELGLEDLVFKSENMRSKLILLNVEKDEKKKSNNFNTTKKNTLKDIKTNLLFLFRNILNPFVESSYIESLRISKFLPVITLENESDKEKSDKGKITSSLLEYGKKYTTDVFDFVNGGFYEYYYCSEYTNGKYTVNKNKSFENFYKSKKVDSSDYIENIKALYILLQREIKKITGGKLSFSVETKMNTTNIKLTEEGRVLHTFNDVTNDDVYLILNFLNVVQNRNISFVSQDYTDILTKEKNLECSFIFSAFMDASEYSVDVILVIYEILKKITLGNCLFFVYDLKNAQLQTLTKLYSSECDSIFVKNHVLIGNNSDFNMGKDRKLKDNISKSKTVVEMNSLSELDKEIFGSNKTLSSEAGIKNYNQDYLNTMLQNIVNSDEEDNLISRSEEVINSYAKNAKSMPKHIREKK